MVVHDLHSKMEKRRHSSTLRMSGRGIARSKKGHTQRSKSFSDLTCAGWDEEEVRRRPLLVAVDLCPNVTLAVFQMTTEGSD